MAFYKWSVTRLQTTPGCCNYAGEGSPWSSGGWNFFYQTATFTPLCAGKFTVHFQGGCWGAQTPPPDYYVIVDIQNIAGTCSWNPPSVKVGTTGTASTVNLNNSYQGNTTVSVNQGDTVYVTASAGCSTCSQSPSFTWTVTPGTVSGSGQEAHFDVLTPGPYVVTFTSTCGSNPCPGTCMVTVNINPLSSFCCVWNNPTVTIGTGGTPTTVLLNPSAEGDITLNGVTPGDTVFVNASAGCTSCAQTPSYEWRMMWQAAFTPGSTASFTASSSGTYIVYFKAHCGSASCPQCKVTVHVNALPCICSWNDPNVTVGAAVASVLLDNSGQGTVNVQAEQGWPININSGGTCTNCLFCGPTPYCTYTIAPDLTAFYGRTATIIPPGPGNYTYTVAFSGVCNGHACPPCTITVNVTVNPVSCWCSWGTPDISADDCYYLPPQTTGSPIPGLYAYSHVRLKPHVTCNGSGCTPTPTYDWVVKRLSITPHHVLGSPPCDTSCEPKVNGVSTWTGSGDVDFMPYCAGTFEVDVTAHCGGNPCPAPPYFIGIDGMTPALCGNGSNGTGYDPATDPNWCGCPHHTNVTISWACGSPGSPQTLVCNPVDFPSIPQTSVKITTLCTGTAVTLTANGISCTGASCPAVTYSWDIYWGSASSASPGNNPLAHQDGPTMTFVPSDYPGYNHGYYEFVLTAVNCSGIPCTYHEVFEVVNTGPPDCTCVTGNPAVDVGWHDQTGAYLTSPGSTCQAGALIQSLSSTLNTIDISNPGGFTCNGTTCPPQPTLTFTVTGPLGFSLPAQNFPGVFNPPVKGTYYVSINASCGNSVCSTCLIPINIWGIFKLAGGSDTMPSATPSESTLKGKGTRGCIQAPPGLIAWWPLDSYDMLTPNCQDIAGPYDGHVVCGNPEPVTGKVSQAARFNWDRQGTIRTDSQSDPFQIIGEGDFTIDAWIYPEPLGSWCQSNMNSPNNYNHFEDRIILDNYMSNRHMNSPVFEPPVWPSPAEGAIAFFVRNEQWDTATTQYASMRLGLAMKTIEFLSPPASLALNQWQHVAVTVARSNGNSVGTFYVNGNPIGNTFIPETGILYSDLAPGYPRMDIGHAFPGIPCPACIHTDDYFSGRLDEIEIFNRPLDPTEINDLYQADSNGKCKGTGECRCGPWDDTTVSFFGTSAESKYPQPSNLQLRAQCGSNVNINSLEGPITVNASIYCLCGPHYSWTVRRTSTPPGCAPSTEPIAWTGSGTTAKFTPECAGQFTVTFNASCDGVACKPCQTIITVDQVVSFICSCQGWDNATISWLVPNEQQWDQLRTLPPYPNTGQQQSQIAHCGDNVTIDVLASGTDIKITSGGVNCSPGCSPSDYTWSVADALGGGGGPWSGNGLTASFMPVIIMDSPTTAPFHEYLVTYTGHCDSALCTCKIRIRINSARGTCQSWNPATVTWTGSSPGAWTGACGGTAPVMIESVNAGTAVQVNSTVACSSPGLQPAYAWSITSSSGAKVASGSGPTASFIPEVPGGYNALFTASCGGAACQASCSIPIKIDNIRPKSTGGTGFPLTCACGAWTPVTVNWPGGSENVKCTSATAPVVSIPFISPGTAVQINSGIACGPGMFNIFTGEACPAGVKWSVTSTFSGQGPWSGSGSTASFVPATEGSFTVVFSASCGNAACPGTCKIHIDVKSMEEGQEDQQPSAPVITSFKPGKTQISPKESVTLDWIIKGDGEAILECAGEKKSVPFTGSTVITPAQSGCCTLTATNKYGSDQETACVTVLSTKEEPPRIISFVPNRTQVTNGESVNFGYQITGADNAWFTCGGQRRAVSPTSGSVSIMPAASGCCTLTASNKVGEAQKTQCITVIQRTPVRPPVIPPVRPPVTPPEVPPATPIETPPVERPGL